MSTYENDNDDDMPRFEPWLRVMTSAFVPGIGILYLPQYLVPLVAIAAVLYVAGLVMLRRQTLRRARQRGDARLPSATPAATLVASTLATSPPSSAARSVDGETVELEGAEP
jgi:hypothetical protein